MARPTCDAERRAHYVLAGREHRAHQPHQGTFPNGSCKKRTERGHPCPNILLVDAQNDDLIARIERFNDNRVGGVVVHHRCGGYTLALEEAGAPIARLKPVDPSDRMRVLYWSHRNRWADAAPLGGIILPLDDALEFIANEPIFWTYT